MNVALPPRELTRIPPVEPLGGCIIKFVKLPTLVIFVAADGSLALGIVPDVSLAAE